MQDIKKIKMNEKVYELPLIPISKEETFSGYVYRLQAENEDLAVKIYHSSCRYDDQIEWFPPQRDLEEFIEVSKEVFPMLLSHKMVFDLENHYIGCASYYIEETEGNIGKVIESLPCSELFTHIFSLIEQVPIISKHYIELDDLAIDNLKYGTIKKDSSKSRIYSFDDSNYTVNKENSMKTIMEDNYDCFNRLAEDFLDYYLPSRYYELLKKMKCSGNYFELLEKVCRGYSNLGEFVKDYTLRKKK